MIDRATCRGHQMHLIQQAHWIEWWISPGQQFNLTSILIMHLLKPIELLEDRHTALTESTLAIVEHDGFGLSNRI